MRIEETKDLKELKYELRSINRVVCSPGPHLLMRFGFQIKRNPKRISKGGPGEHPTFRIKETCIKSIARKKAYAKLAMHWKTYAS